MGSNTRFRAGLAAFILIATTRVCFAVSCGDTITTAETLTADLNCSTEPALVIEAGGSLDLNSFEVTCDGTMYGIVLDADKTSVSNGRIGNCTDTALSLAANGHKVTGIYIFDSSVGISAPVIDATGIKIKDTVVVGATVAFDIFADGTSITGVSLSATNSGMRLFGSGNKIKDVTIIDGSNRGLDLSGDGGNKVTNVRIADANTGVDCTSPNNKLSNIHSANQDSFGLYIGADGNKVAGSTFINEGSSYGIFLASGTGQSVSNCTTLAGQKGIYHLAGLSEISKSRAFGSLEHGVYVGSSNSVMKGNVGLGNGIYDFDDSSSCVTNVWSKNIGKKGQSCIE